MLYCEVFRLEQSTTFELIKRKACEYWGLMDRDFGLFTIDDSNQPVAIEDDDKVNVMEFLETDSRHQMDEWLALKENQRNNLHNIDNDGNYICQFYLGKLKQV